MRLVVVEVEGRRGGAADEIDADGTVWGDGSSTGRTIWEERAYTKKIKREVGRRGNILKLRGRRRRMTRASMSATRSRRHL